jgi:hypothetical protein
MTNSSSSHLSEINYCRHFQMPLNFYDSDDYLNKPNLAKITRLVFLDIDGVLNFEGTNVDALNWTCSFNANQDDKYPGIFPDLVSVLNRLHSTYPDVRYVLSSTWRSNYYGTIEYLKLQGFTGSIISRTKQRSEGSFFVRSEEIKDWVSYCNYTGNYIVIDDDDECLVFGNQLIHSNYKTGITSDLIDSAINYFANLP